MSVGGIGADVPIALPEAKAAADAAAPAGGPTPHAVMANGVARPAPAPRTVAADGFARPVTHAAVPDLGADVAQGAALADFRAAKADLRQAKAIPEGTAGRRKEIRQARREVRDAKAEMAAAQAGGGAIHPAGLQAAPGASTVDTFAAGGRPPGAVPFDDDAFDAPGADDLFDAPDVIQAQGPGNGLALGRQLPAISQLNPRGNDGTYTNADMNCAPAAMAMIARSIPGLTLDGHPVSQIPDAALINRLGKHGQTDAQGTSPNGVIAMAEQLGLSTSARRGGLDTNYVDSILAQGGSVVANGAYNINGELAGHFVTVSARTPDGNYLVNDPLLGRSVVYTPAELDAFLRRNPVNGGVSIGVV